MAAPVEFSLSPFVLKHAQQLCKRAAAIDYGVICKKWNKFMINESANDLPLWGKLHEAIQWILYVPVVFGLSIAFSFLFNLLSTSRGDFEGIFLYLQVPLNAGLMATLSVWLALNLAPRRAKVSAWVIYSVWSIFRFFAIVIFGESISIQQSDVIELLQGIGWLSAGIFILFRWGKDFSSNIEKTVE